MEEKAADRDKVVEIEDLDLALASGGGDAIDPPPIIIKSGG